MNQLFQNENSQGHRKQKTANSGLAKVAVLPSYDKKKELNELLYLRQNKMRLMNNYCVTLESNCQFLDGLSLCIINLK